MGRGGSLSLLLYYSGTSGCTDNNVTEFVRCPPLFRASKKLFLGKEKVSSFQRCPLISGVLRERVSTVGSGTIQCSTTCQNCLGKEMVSLVSSVCFTASQ